MSDIDLLVVGRDGNGKSSTANSILGRTEFKPRSTSYQGSDDVQKHRAEIDGRKVTVVDGISVRDGCTDSPENVQAIISLATQAVQIGFTALLIVLKYGVRFTNQEKNAIRIIKCLFGDDVLRKHGVIVMSYGDSFASDMEGEETTFDDWCRQQTGECQDLFKECGNRYVLFNNREKDGDRKKDQVRNLMSKVEAVKSRASKYTSESFKQAWLGQRKLLVESKLPELEKLTTRILDSVTQKLRKLDDSYFSEEDYLREMDSLKVQIDNHKSYLQEEDEGTNSIGRLLIQISVTEASISTKRERYLRKAEYDALISNSRTSLPHNKSRSNYKWIYIFAIIGILFVAFIIFNNYIYAIIPFYGQHKDSVNHNSSPSGHL
ncbi:hypothetical protein BsWGS_18511 [Bradybaena similaris]